MTGHAPAAGEFATSVDGDWAGAGLGRVLLTTLIDGARRPGLSEIDGFVLASNQPMLNLAARLGFSIVRDPEDATVRICRLSLAPPRGDRMTGPTRFRAAAALAIAGAASLGAVAHASAAACEPRDLAFGRTTVKWSHQPLSKLKRDTVYTTVKDDGGTVLRATADRSASMYVATLDAAAGVPTTIDWRWRTDALVPGADNRVKSREDAPLRVMVAFDGDLATLPEEERKRFTRAKSLSGRAPPYAVLMYVWSDHVPVETVIPSAHTSQVRMLVAASGTAGLGRWQTVRRNVLADYRTVYGGEPGRLLGVAVMTDTDNTGTRASGDYADIRLGCGPD